MDIIQRGLSEVPHRRGQAAGQRVWLRITKISEFLKRASADPRAACSWRTSRAPVKWKTLVCETNNETSTKETPTSRGPWKSGNEQLAILTRSPMRGWYEREACETRILRKWEPQECNSSASFGRWLSWYNLPRDPARSNPTNCENCQELASRVSRVQ